MNTEPGTQIQSVARACRILLFVSEEPDGCNASEIAKAYGLALPTTYHLLKTLVAEGMLTKDSRRRYSIGPKIGALSDAFMRQISTPEYLLLPLRELAESTGETTYLTAWRGNEIRVLAAVEGAQAVRVAGLHTGYYQNGHARATGKLLLAYAPPSVRSSYLRDNPLAALTAQTITDKDELQREFEKIRQRGYSYDIEEFVEGVCCVAAPVLENGVAIAAYTVSVPSDRFAKKRKAITAAVRSTASGARPITPAAMVEKVL